MFKKECVSLFFSPNAFRMRRMLLSNVLEALACSFLFVVDFFTTGVSTTPCVPLFEEVADLESVGTQRLAHRLLGQAVHRALHWAGSAAAGSHGGASAHWFERRGFEVSPPCLEKHQSCLIAGFLVVIQRTRRDLHLSRCPVVPCVVKSTLAARESGGFLTNDSRLQRSGPALSY